MMKLGFVISRASVRWISFKEKLAMDLFMMQPKRVSSFASFTPGDFLGVVAKLICYRNAIEESVSEAEDFCLLLNSMGKEKQAEINKMVEEKR